MRSGETVEEAIIQLSIGGIKKFHIRKMIGCGPQRIDNALAYYNENAEIPSPKKIGRPSKATEEVISKICEMTFKDPTISAFKICSELFSEENIKISPTTVNEYRKKLDFNNKYLKIRQELTEKQKETRYLFSNSVLANKIDLKKIIFSDESRFCLQNDGNMRWIKKGENENSFFVEKKKYNQGIIVYGAIGIDYKSDLVICENSIDDIEYRNIIERSNMVKSLGENYKEGEYFFMQDGAPAHKSHLIFLYLKKRL